MLNAVIRMSDVSAPMQVLRLDYFRSTEIRTAKGAKS